MKLSLKFLAVRLKWKVKQIAEPLQEQQPERTPFNQEQDQGNVVFQFTQTEMITVVEA